MSFHSTKFVASAPFSACAHLRPSLNVITPLVLDKNTNMNASPVVHVELVLLEETLGGRVLGLDAGHELVQLPPLLPHRPRHVLCDLCEGSTINMGI